MSDPFPHTTSSVSAAVRSSFGIRQWLAIIQIHAALALGSWPLSAAQQTFTWMNPVTGGPDWIRDAYILRVGDHYYLTGTRRIASTPDEPGRWPGLYLWSSADLLNWKEELQGGAPPPYDSPRLCLDPLNFNFRTGEFSSVLSWKPQTISFNPASPAAQRARNEPLGSVLEQYGEP